MRASLDQGQPTKSAESVRLSRRYNYIISVLARNDAFHRVRVGEWDGREWGRRERAHITCVMAPAEAEGGDGYDRDGKRTSERTCAWRRIRPRLHEGRAHAPIVRTRHVRSSARLRRGRSATNRSCFLLAEDISVFAQKEGSIRSGSTLHIPPLLRPPL